MECLGGAKSLTLGKRQELTRAELTQRRAEEALKKHRAAVKARKERERVSKKAKRAGGGFVIEFSREV